MNLLRHAAALALVGWYLMLPPVESCIGVFVGQPCAESALLKWRVARTLDSALKCEALKDANIEKGRRYLADENRNLTRTRRVQPSQAEYMTWIAAKCVATDDPRLKGK